MLGSNKRPLSNKELYRYKRTHGLWSSTEPSLWDKLWRAFTQLVLYTLWQALLSLGGPVRRVLGLQLWLGRSLLAIALHIQRHAFRLIGWLAGREAWLCRSSQFYFGSDVRRWHVGLVAIIVGSLVHSGSRRVYERYDERMKRRRALNARKLLAQSYSEWRNWALQIEKLDTEKKAAYKAAPAMEAYDKRLLLQKTTHLRRVRATGVVGEMMHAVRTDLVRNVANIATSQKHCPNFVSVPEPIQCYMQEVKDQLQQICDWPDADLSVEDKLAFFRVTRHTFGRTALLLSGGGGLGIFHLGVCRGLFECKLLPRILAGSSVGSIVCAAMCVRTDAELRDTFDDLVKFDMGFFQDNNCYAMMKQAIEKGHLHDMDTMIGKLRELLGDSTFAEAYERTGRILNVTVCPADTIEPPRLLNYMTAPNVLVWSGVAASSSFPGLYPPQFLVGRNSQGQICRMHQDVGANSLQRRWRDGSLEFDLPAQALAEMFNCNHFLVSQTNPHIVPLLNFKSLFPKWWASFMEAELKHRLSMLQCFAPAWTKWLTLFTQPWEGDITFTLPSSLWNIRKTVVNPTVMDLQAAVRAGEQTVWEHMPAIECNCTLEATLDKCVAKVQHQMRGRNSSLIQPNSNRLPSFVNLPPNGMLNFQTWGDSIAGNDISQVTSWGDFSSLESNPPGLRVQPLYRSSHGYSLVELALGRDAKQHHQRLMLEDGKHRSASCGLLHTGIHDSNTREQLRLPPISSRASSMSCDDARSCADTAECGSAAGGGYASSGMLEHSWTAGGAGWGSHHSGGSGTASSGPVPSQCPSGSLNRSGSSSTHVRGSGLSRRSSCMSKLSALGGSQETGEEPPLAPVGAVQQQHHHQHHHQQQQQQQQQQQFNGSSNGGNRTTPAAAPAAAAAVTAPSLVGTHPTPNVHGGNGVTHAYSNGSSSGRAAGGAAAANGGPVSGAAGPEAHSKQGGDAALEQHIIALAQASCPDGTTRILGSFLPLAGVSEALTEPLQPPEQTPNGDAASSHA